MTSPSLRRLTAADPPSAWADLGFSLPDGSCVVGDVVLEVGPHSEGRGLTGWAFASADATVPAPADIDGIPTSWVDGASSPLADPPRHPNDVAAIDHVVVLSPHLERTVTAFEAAGFDVRRVREVPDEQYGFAARQVFFRSGEVILELIAAAEPDPDPVRRDRPARLYGLAFTVGDLDALSLHLGDRLGPAKDAVQPGRRIATVRRAAGLSTAVAFMSVGVDALG